MISWKRLPVVLYQTGQTGNRARQQRDRESVCVRGSTLLKEGGGVSNKMDC